MRLCTRTAYILSVINLSRPVATNLGNLYHVGRSLHTVEQYVFLKLGPLLLGLRGIVLRLHGPMDGHIGLHLFRALCFTEPSTNCLLLVYISHVDYFLSLLQK